MGHFYTNYTVRCPDHNKVAVALSGRAALITVPKNNSVVVFDRDSDSQGIAAADGFAEELSRLLQCSVLAVSNHGDDVLSYVLYDSGRKVDEYCSAPDYFTSEDGPGDPKGGDARALCNAFGARDEAVVEGILRRSGEGAGGYIFEVDRHLDLANALGIANYGVGFTFDGIFKGTRPVELGRGDIIGPP